jgi:hypothetical protein
MEKLIVLRKMTCNAFKERVHNQNTEPRPSQDTTPKGVTTPSQVDLLPQPATRGQAVLKLCSCFNC